MDYKSLKLPIRKITKGNTLLEFFNIKGFREPIYYKDNEIIGFVELGRTIFIYYGYESKARELGIKVW